MAEVKGRIAQLEVEVMEFKRVLDEKNNLIQQTQNEIQDIIQGILTRQGGIVELKKLIGKNNKKEVKTPTSIKENKK